MIIELVMHPRNMCGVVCVVCVCCVWCVVYKCHSYSPRCDNEEVHEVPWIPHVATLMQHKAKGKDLGQHFRGENHHEDNLHLFLYQKESIRYLTLDTR